MEVHNLETALLSESITIENISATEMSPFSMQVSIKETPDLR